MGGDSWGFEDAEDWELSASSAGEQADAAEPESLVGRDADGVIEVTVSPDGQMRSVKLAEQWRRSIDPRVLSAANAATMRALSAAVEQSDLTEGERPEKESPAVLPAETPPPLPAEPPQGNLEMRRLIDSAAAELAQFTSRMTQGTDRTVRAQSAGGHVRGGARNGQIIELTVEPGWADVRRNSEIESELLEVLRSLQASSTPPRELSAGPRGPAISELLALAGDP